MIKNLAERCAESQEEIVKSVDAADLRNDPIGKVALALSAIPGLIPALLAAVQDGGLDDRKLRTQIRDAVRASMEEIHVLAFRKFLAAMVIGGVSLVFSAGLAGYVLGDKTAESHLLALGTFISMDGPEAREWLRLINANHGNLRASMATATRWTDPGTGKEAGKVSLWLSSGSSDPAPLQ